MPTILVVDDDADICQSMADLLGDFGYVADVAECGETALVRARRNRYDLCLLDLRMTGMDGLTLCRHLKRLQPRTVVIIITGYAGGDLNEEARSAGAHYVLPKPIDFPSLLALIEQAAPRSSCERSGSCMVVATS